MPVGPRGYEGQTVTRVTNGEVMVVRIVEHAAGSTVAEGDWADQTRRVLTRDLLLRAHRAQPTEGQALQFRDRKSVV